MAIYHSLDFSNHAFRVYVTWGGFLLLKMLFMSFLTMFHRLRTGAVESPEDAAINKKMTVKKDEAVERVRRAHLNDLENIPIFMLAALMYIISEPDPMVAAWLIRIAVLARIGHTTVYAVFGLPMPLRSICFFTTLIITIFMIVWAMVVFFHF